MDGTERAAPPSAPIGPPPESVPGGPLPRRPRFGCRRRGLPSLGLLRMLAVFLLVFLAGSAGWLASGRAIVAPDWVADRIEARAAEALATRGRLTVGRIALVLTPEGLPRLALRDLILTEASGHEVARIPDLRLRLDPRALLRRDLRVTRLAIDGASVTLRRDAQGRFGVLFGDGVVAVDPAVIRAAVERALDRPAFSGATAELTDLSLTVEDAASGLVWRAEHGRLDIAQEPGRARAATLQFTLRSGGATAEARVTAAASAAPGQPLDFRARIEGPAARGLATQVPGLSLLATVEAPLSAGLSGVLGADGQLQRLEADLSLGAGAIRPPGAAADLDVTAFDRVAARMAYDPAARRLALSDLSVEAGAVRFAATGQILLDRARPGGLLPERAVIQLALRDVLFAPDGELAAPARFATGAADLRLGLAPFRVDLGQLSLTGDTGTLRARGHALSGTDGWDLALDADVDRLSAADLVALWPLRLAPRTRDWIARNLRAGTVDGARAVLRVPPGGPPVLSLGYGFSGAELRVLPSLPPVQAASGRSTLEGDRMVVVVSEGSIDPGPAGRISVADTVFTIPDIRAQPARAEVDLVTDAPIGATLALLDLPPFEVMRRAGRPPDIAEGRARLRTRLDLSLGPGLRLADVDFQVSGTLEQVRSDRIVPGRTLAADRLTLSATPDAITIAGPGRLGQAQFDAGWTQPIGPDAGPARVEGSVVLDDGFLEEFAIDLPPGTVSGSGSAQITLDLPRGAPARFALVSDLNRLRLSVPALGWSKGPAVTGRLDVSGSLGQPSQIDRIALDAPGLVAEGRLELATDGSLALARFDRVRAGGWLDAPVTLRPRGTNRAPAIEIGGGSLDLRRLQPGLGGGSGAGGGPIDLALDRVTVSEGIVFTGVRGQLSTVGGLSGSFTAALGGTAPVTGALAPSAEGTAVRLQSEDAGRVLAASGLIRSAVGGRMDLTLIPQPGQGLYAGRLAIDGIGLRGAPVLAGLLSAISVVGLLEQLNGQGIFFNEVTGEFVLSPEGVTLQRGSAVGASMGVSMAGVYDLRSRSMDMQGTVSPFYLLNGIGSFLTRRGEGLFGFNYRMTGPASGPQTTVNPLSILTPGMFREIFRAAAPQLGQ